VYLMLVFKKYTYRHIVIHTVVFVSHMFLFYI